MRSVRVVALAGLGAVVLAACSSSESTSAGNGASDRVGGSIVVSAAASLRDAFSEIADEFERAHPGATVRLNLGSSAQLTAQITQGAPADVVATADEEAMDRLVRAGEVADEPDIFAENTLAIVTHPNNPERIRKLSDLADVETLALCVAAAPCGRFADRALDRAGVSVASDHITRGTDARVTLAAVTQNDADAAIVYVTDALIAAGAVATVSIPAADNETARYPIAILERTDESTTARAFVAFVRGSTGRRVLTDHGFMVP